LISISTSQADNKTISFSDDEITATNCQLLKNQLQTGVKLFLFYHGSHRKSIKKLFEMCQFNLNKVIEKKFHYIGVTIYQE